jgi:hypothetical protein
LKRLKQKVIEGWENIPKALFQVLWERGFIDKLRLEIYTLNGKQDANWI